MIPASTLKIATSFCALEELGPNFRFKTEFFTDDDGSLFIRGGGDPALVSEELALIARRLVPSFPKLSRIVIDDSRFGSGIRIDGASNTDNPYDAPPGAFLVNFNTITVSKTSRGSLSRGEPQTPLTPLARSLASKLSPGNHRISIGSDVKRGSIYAAELLATMMLKDDSKTLPPILFGRISQDARPLFEFESSETLSDTIRGLLKFSTNFSANQLFLILGASKLGFPATVAKGKSALSQCLQERLNWRNFNVEEGAGLSRKNQVSAAHMIDLLVAFEPYRELLPIDSGFKAKTGTLTGVNSLVGYFDLPGNQKARFAILVNSPVPHSYKFELAHLLYRGLTGVPNSR